jgi:hypothetical protein
LLLVDCDPQALGHIGYYFDNYISPSKADGGHATEYLIDYYTWAPTRNGNVGDSLSDFGRLIELYLKAVRYCTDGASAEWSSRYLPKAVMMGNLLLKLRKAATNPTPAQKWSCYTFTAQEQKDINAKKVGNKCEQACEQEEQNVCEKGGHAFTHGNNADHYGCGTCWCCQKATPSAPSPGPTPAPGTKGLLKGPPEHDFGRDRSHYYYNNQVWSLRGLESLGQYLTEGPTPVNATLGQQLLKEATGMRTDLEASIATCAVPGGSKDEAAAVKLLPPFAELGFTPYKTMTDTRDSSYANFR